MGMMTRLFQAFLTARLKSVVYFHVSNLYRVYNRYLFAYFPGNAGYGPALSVDLVR